MITVRLDEWESQAMCLTIYRAICNCQARVLPVRLPVYLMVSAIDAVVHERPEVIKEEIAQKFRDLSPLTEVVPTEYEALAHIANLACDLCLYQIRSADCDPLMVQTNRDIVALLTEMEAAIEKHAS